MVMFAPVLLVAIRRRFLRAIRLGWETARDLLREVRRTYPELVQAVPNSRSAGLAIKR